MIGSVLLLRSRALEPPASLTTHMHDQHVLRIILIETVDSAMLIFKLVV